MRRKSLRFGGQPVGRFESPKEAICEAHRTIPGIEQFDFSAHSAFFYETVTVRLNDLKLTLVNSSAARITVGGRPEPMLYLPLQGAIQFKGGGATLEATPKAAAVYLPADCPSDIVGTDRSLVLIRYDAKRLKATARFLLKNLKRRQPLNVFDDPSAIALAGQRPANDRVFRGLLKIFNAWGTQDQLRNQSGLDEAFYRATVMAMLPELFRDQPIQH